MSDRTNEDLAREVAGWAAAGYLPGASETMQLVAERLQSSVSAAEHDRRVSELLEANTLLIGRARAARTPPPRARFDQPWRPSHLHYKSGAPYRLNGALWIEADAILAFRYSTESGRQWVRPAAAFLETVRHEGVTVRRFAPAIGELRRVEADLGRITPGTPEPLHRYSGRITLHEYMILANAALLCQGVPIETISRYGHAQWLDAWRNGVEITAAAALEVRAMKDAA